MKDRVVIAGLGEIGKPLGVILEDAYEVVGIDIPHPPLESIGPVDVLHICYPFEIDDFVGETVGYVTALRPRLTIVNSTVGVGTTRRIGDAAGAPVAHSPVRGKHTRMVEDMRGYVKFVGGVDDASSAAAADHFRRAGLQTRELGSAEATELAKLTETTYFGLLIAWAQQVERYADLEGVGYDEVASFYDEIGYLPPVRFFPGVIGGHCVVPNIEILDAFDPSGLTAAIKASNEAKVLREAGRKAL